MEYIWLFKNISNCYKIRKNNVKGALTMPGDMQTTIKEIESAAEKLIEEARIKARKILEDARVKTKSILTSELPLDEVEGEKNKIISKAEDEARKVIEESQKKASKLKTSSSKKIDEIVKRISGNLKGEM
jgi:vacuolar-type H+-ATPase subunit H